MRPMGAQQPMLAGGMSSMEEAMMQMGGYGVPAPMYAAYQPAEYGMSGECAGAVGLPGAGAAPEAPAWSLAAGPPCEAPGSHPAASAAGALGVAARARGDARRAAFELTRTGRPAPRPQPSASWARPARRR
jgi:hypothetical protein